MEIGKPFRVITTSVDGDVLKVLALAPQTEFTPPNVQHLIGERSVAGVRKSLTRLADQGIVTVSKAGNAFLYRFNEQHMAAPAVAALADLRSTLLARMTATIEEWSEPCVYAALFGSGARGAMRTDSDLDVFIVRPEAVDAEDDVWATQLGELSLDVSRWTGNDTRVLEYSESDVRKGLRIDEAVLADIAREGVRLTGPSRYLKTAKVRRR